MKTGTQNVKQKNNTIETGTADQDIEIILYTDPLCCWSWAARPQLEMLRAHLGQRVNWNIRMGGLLPDWMNFSDQTNMVTRPVQMGPVWMHAGQVAGKPIRHQLWLTDPPASSYPACIAVKCAWLQSDSLGEYYLEFIRDSCMSRGVNISKVVHLFELAEQFSLVHTTFNLHRFRDDFGNGNGKEAFRHDLEFARYNNINRFPTLIIKYNQKSMMVPGYRAYEEIMTALTGFLKVDRA
jgi:predicted DsbA family dithiol-disulfide isomerase